MAVVKSGGAEGRGGGEGGAEGRKAERVKRNLSPIPSSKFLSPRPPTRPYCSWHLRRRLGEWNAGGNHDNCSLGQTPPQSSFIISEFTQQDRRKKRTTKRLSVTNVTGLLIACFVGKSLLTLMFFALLQKDLFKGMWSLAEGFFKQNFCHACHTRFAVVFPLLSCCVSLLFLSAVTEQSWETLTASRRRGRWERREGKKKETHLPAHALPLFYILKISGKLKKITSYADFLRRSPKNVCVGGYKGYYFRRS